MRSIMHWIIRELYRSMPNSSSNYRPNYERYYRQVGRMNFLLLISCILFALAYLQSKHGGSFLDRLPALALMSLGLALVLVQFVWAEQTKGNNRAIQDRLDAAELEEEYEDDDYYDDDDGYYSD